jgi:hypothetical protein
MKIKISKNQWNNIGKLAGWTKKPSKKIDFPAEIPPVSFPDFDLYGVKDGNVNIQIDRYPNSRFWQITLNGKLLAVVVYKKGAESIKSVIESLTKK